jgi:hypothetical protein
MKPSVSSPNPLLVFQLRQTIDRFWLAFYVSQKKTQLLERHTCRGKTDDLNWYSGCFEKKIIELKEARDKKIRDDWIRVMEMRINQEKLAECYRTEGVNSYEQCAHLAQTVISQIPEGRASLSS